MQIFLPNKKTHRFPFSDKTLSVLIQLENLTTQHLSPQIAAVKGKSGLESDKFDKPRHSYVGIMYLMLINASWREEGVSEMRFLNSPKNSDDIGIYGRCLNISERWFNMKMLSKDHLFHEKKPDLRTALLHRESRKSPKFHRSARQCCSLKQRVSCHVYVYVFC